MAEVANLLNNLCNELNINLSSISNDSYPISRSSQYLIDQDSVYDSDFWKNDNFDAETLLERYNKRRPLIAKSDWPDKIRMHPLAKIFNQSGVKLKEYDRPYVRICAPMVRYSKLPFRRLIQNYGVDLVYTPMILADVFKNSQISRETDFTTDLGDDPVIVQFGAPNAKDFADAAELVAPFANGVDLNCGCPQRWAINEGIGAYMMQHPELVQDMVRQAKSRTSPIQMVGGNSSSFPISIKIRIHSDLRQTVEFVKRAEAIGVDWITVHGRTKNMKSTDPVNLDAIKLAKESVQVPVFANGDIFSLEDADQCVSETGVDGVMAARGLLENPALFAGYSHTPVECIKQYVRLAMEYGGTHFIAQHHLMYMMENNISRTEKRQFNILATMPAILDYFQNKYDWDFS